MALHEPRRGRLACRRREGDAIARDRPILLTPARPDKASNADAENATRGGQRIEPKCWVSSPGFTTSLMGLPK